MLAGIPWPLMCTVTIGDACTVKAWVYGIEVG